MDDAFGHWLAGFLDGEGCFGIGCRKPSDSSPLAHYFCFVSVKLRDDDRAILEEIQKRTGLGRIYTNKARGRSKTGAHWLIINRADCRALVDLLDKYPLRAKKARDYAIWRKAALLWATQRRGRPCKGVVVDRTRWRGLHAALCAVREYHVNQPR